MSVRGQVVEIQAHERTQGEDCAARCTVVVATADRPDALRSCLGSLTAHLAAHADQAEVLVVDNGTRSVEHLVREVARASPVEVTLLRSPTGNLALARNLGLRASRGAVVAFTDDDCLVTASYGMRLVRLAADEDVGFWFGPILLGDPADAPVGIDHDTTSWVVEAGSVVRPGVAQGANLVLRRSTALAIGGFDRRLGAGTRFRCEDLDLVARLLRTGISGRHVGDLVVEHHHGRRRASRAHRRIDRANSFAIGAFHVKQQMDGDRRYAARFGASLLATRKPFERRIDLKAAQLLGAATFALVIASDAAAARVGMLKRRLADG